VFDELVETVGSWLLPLLSNLGDFVLSKIVPAFQYVSDVIGPKVEGVFSRLGEVFRSQILPVLQDYIIPAFLYLADIYYTKIIPAATLIAKVFIEKLGEAFAMIREKIEANAESFAKLRDFMDKTVTFITRYVVPAYAKYLSDALSVAIWTAGKLIDSFVKIGEIVGPVMRSVGLVVQTVVKGIVGGINATIDAINAFIGIYNRLPGFMKPVGNIVALPNIELPTFDLTNYKPGGFGYFGENRGGMLGNVAVAAPSVSAGGFVPPSMGAATGGPSGGRTGGTGPSAGGSGPSFSSLGLALDLSNYQPNFADTPEMQAITININSMIAEASVGDTIVEALRDYNRTTGPLRVSV
jgi:hypothetical protein